MMQMLDVGGVRYAYEEAGTGPLILFGHSLYFDRSMFAAQAGALSGRFRCVRLDWPGHGNSAWRREGWSVWHLVDDVARIIRLLGESRAILVGVSQGAAVFARAAARHPDMARALVIMGANPNAFAPETRTRLLAQSRILASRDREQIAGLFAALPSRVFSPKTLAQRPDLVARAMAIFGAHDPEGLACAVRLPTTYDALGDHLASIECPAMVMWGEDDRAAPIALAERYRQDLRDATFATIADCGHSLPLEQPENVTRSLNDFLSARISERA